MPKAKRYDLSGKVLGDVDLPETAFGIEPNQHVVWESVKIYMANQRQGTASTKGRSEVRGGGRKPWRQKGTGRARVGSIRSPIWVGGGIVFGPQPRSYRQQQPQKVRRLAMVSALSQRAKEGNVVVVEGFAFDVPKTSMVADFLKTAGLDRRKVCFITGRSDPMAVKSCRNIPGVQILSRGGMNIYDLVKADVLVIANEALDGIKEAYGS